MRERTIGLLLIAVVALGAMTGAAAADGHLEVAVDKDADGTSTVTVTENDTAVENATVNVSVVDPANESYAGAGEYETDANGTVDLPAPEENVTVNVTAASGNETVSTTVDLVTQEDETPEGLELDVANTGGEPVVTVTDDDIGVENASVNVMTADGQNATYVGAGDYETDENGTVTLDAAEENVTVDVTAEYENESVSTTVDLVVDGDGEADENQPFGQLVQDFVDRLEDREGGIGAAVSDFVTENNPGNAPDHAGGPGGPDDAGNGSDAGDASDGPGNAPDHAGNGNDSEQGPPDHAGPGGDDGDDANESDDRGPPEHAGPNGDDGDDTEEDDADDAEEDDADESEEEDEEDADEDDEEDDDDGNAGNGPGNGNAPQ